MPMNAQGARTWMIGDGYWPEVDTPGHYVSHEAICLLNTGRDDATVQIVLFFEDRPPQDGFFVTCAAQRTVHVRMDKLRDQDGNGVPRGVPYAALVHSDVPIMVQYSRLDTTQPNMSLCTTVAYPLAEEERP